MKTANKLLILLSAAALTALHSLNAAVQINYLNGDVFTSDATGPLWVGGSQMYKKIDSGNATASSQTGMDAIFGALDMSLFTWTFDDLDLVIGESVSPGAATPGLETYRDLDNSSNLQFFYDGNLWASGLITEYLVFVDNNSDFDATGRGLATINANTAAGQDFFDEIMFRTGGTGIIDFEATSFAAVAAGHFQSDGSIVIPEPSTYALFAGASILLFATVRRKRQVA